MSRRRVLRMVDEVHWADGLGVVHIVGLHTNNSVRTECNAIIIKASFSKQHYDRTEAPASCLRCIVFFEGWELEYY